MEPTPDEPSAPGDPPRIGDGRSAPGTRADSPARYEVLVPPPPDGSTRARLGRLTLPHGVVETPQFMPVGTNATVKALDPADLREVGATIILSNTYHLYLRPGHERIAALGGLHRFMAWDRPILTDSGGFQVVSMGELRKIDDDGVTFQSHLDGSHHRFTPEHSIAVQEALGADVAVAFDQPVPPASSTQAAVAEATARTGLWAERSLAAHTRPDQALFGIVQGGLDPDLRAESTAFISGLPFDGICIGGLAGDETAAQRECVLDVVVGLLETDPRPRYLMGLGSPADLLEAVHRGIDLFDSVLPARVARNGQLWVPEGRLNMRNARFVDDPRPVQEGCRCLLCRQFSRAYLAHLFRSEELLAYRLATCHNLTFTLDFMAGIRSALRAGTFSASLSELRERVHPSRSRELAVQSE
jgi:queuine tRNA-ribosyltransferase